jgi:uncharacterized membrane protein YeiH
VFGVSVLAFVAGNAGGVARGQRIVLLFDAAGLATFAVSGTQKALAYGADAVAGGDTTSTHASDKGGEA